MAQSWQSGTPQRTLAILCGGGPAPGLNGVIESVVTAAHARGWAAVGIRKGFSGLMQGDASQAVRLSPADVAGVATRGGCILLTSRANPTKDPRQLAAVVESLRRMGVTDLVTVGGDDTATSALKVAAAAGGSMRVAHVPKTIDNDLPLPGDAPTFGFETAKHWGALLCRNLLVDAETTQRWVLVTAMGRSAGHLALGMAAGSGAHLCVIPEEFQGPVTVDAVAALVRDAAALRRQAGQDWGLAVLAEGLLDRMEAPELSAIAHVGKDEHGNPRLSEVDLGRVVRDRLASDRAPEASGMVTKLIGYELRCADPVGFDVQYTRSLGACAVEFLATGEGSALIALRDGRLAPLRLEDLRDPATGKVRLRRVDPQGALWKASLALQARRQG